MDLPGEEKYIENEDAPHTKLCRILDVCEKIAISTYTKFYINYTSFEWNTIIFRIILVKVSWYAVK